MSELIYKKANIKLHANLNSSTIQNNYVESNELFLDLDLAPLESKTFLSPMNYTREDMNLFENEHQFEQESLIGANDQTGWFLF